MRYDFDPYSGADIMDSRDINQYLEELIDEVSSELQYVFNISEDDALLFIEYSKSDLTTIPETTKKQIKIIDRIYTAMDNVREHNKKKKWDDDGRLDKIKELQELIDENSGYGDWDHGTTLIKDDYFPEYAKQFAEDIGVINSDSDRWPNTCIDWEQAADELRQDYTACEIDGTTYYYR